MRLAAAFLLAISTLAAADYQPDIPYRTIDGVTLHLDASIPEGSGPHPAVILVHGGGWEAGDKRTYITPIFEPLTEAGFAWFSIDYRLAPVHTWPAPGDDVLFAIRWIRDRAARFRIDPRRLALVGESAGGHLVSWAATRVRPGDVAAVVPFYGVHDFVSFAAHYKGELKNIRQLLGVERLTSATVEQHLAASPLAFVHPQMPPLLMIHGTEDSSVPYRQSLDMCDAARGQGVPCDVYPVAGEHGMGNWEKRPELHHYKAKLVEWLGEQFDE